MRWPLPTAPDFARALAPLRRAALVLALTLGVAGGIAVSSHTVFLRQQSILLRTQAEHANATRQLAQLKRQRALIDAYGARYGQLRARGFVGTERRLEWIEAIKRIQAARKLLPIAYTIEPQQTVAQVDATGDELHASRMTVRMALWHEIDLFRLLDDLRAAGLYALQDCTIRRSATAPAGTMAAGPAEAATAPAGPATYSAAGSATYSATYAPAGTAAGPAAGSAAGPPAAADAPLLTAECSLEWLTLAPSSTTKAAP